MPDLAGFFHQFVVTRNRLFRNTFNTEPGDHFMKLLNTYRLIEAVVQHGSFRKAADKMAITSTALNRRIISFEQEMGVKLFERKPNGVALTVAGEVMIDHIRKYFSDFDRVRSTIDDLSGVRRGHVSICTSVQLDPVLPSQVRDYRNEHPGVTFDINFAKPPVVQSSLVDYRSDLGIFLGPLDQRVLQSIYAVPLTVDAIMRSDHPLAKSARVSAGDCTEFEVALPSPEMGVRDVIDDFMQAKGINISPVLEVNSIGFLVDYTLSSDVVSFVIRPDAFALPLPDGLVARAFKGNEQPIINLHLAHLKGRVLSVAAAKFSSLLASKMAFLTQQAQVDSQ